MKNDIGYLYAISDGEKVNFYRKGEEMEIPKFLLEMSEQLNTQDNRITADPLFCVYYDEKVPTSEDYADGHEYYDDEGLVGDFEDYRQALIDNADSNEEYIERLLEFAGCDDLGEVCEGDLDSFDEYTMCFYKVFHLKKKHFVKASLTEAGAQQFIDRKQHDYAPLYIYAESMCYQWQAIELRKWIMSITQKQR